MVNLRAASGAEAALDRLAAASLIIHVLGQGRLAVVNGHLLRFDIEVTGDVTASHFATVGAVAKVSPASGPELRIGDCDLD